VGSQGLDGEAVETFAPAILLAWLSAGVGLAIHLGTLSSPLEERGDVELPWLPLAPRRVQDLGGFEWGQRVEGPAFAVVSAEAALMASSVGILVIVAAIGGLGYLAFEGVRAVSNRRGVRTRRAVGATIQRILLKRLGAVGRQLSVALPLAIVGLFVLDKALGAVHEPIALPLPSTVPGIGAWFASLGLLIVWAGFSYWLVQSGEAVAGRPLDPGAVLSNPVQGNICHPAVPVLQIASCSALTVVALLLLPSWDAGSSRLWEGSGPPPGNERVTLEARGPDWRPLVEGLLERTAEVSGGVSVASAGFHMGFGYERFARTECGRCFHPGSPPVPAPFKGERAVHYGVTPEALRARSIGVLDGRPIKNGDVWENPNVALVTEGFARRNFEDGDAVGRRVLVGSAPDGWHTIVGIIQPVVAPRLVAGGQVSEAVLVPVTGLPTGVLELAGSDLPPEEKAFADAGFAVVDRGTALEREAALTAWMRWYRWFWWISTFAGVSVAIVGVASTVSRRVWEERREMGIARAVGAGPGQLAFGYARLGLTWGAVGALVGCWAALFFVTVLRPQLLVAPKMMLSILGPVAASMALLSGLSAGVSARIALRGTPRETMEC